MNGEPRDGSKGHTIIRAMKDNDRLDFVRSGSGPPAHRLIGGAAKDIVRACPFKWKG